MTLPTNGPLSLDDIQTEFGGVNPIGMDEYYGAASGVPVSPNPISINDFYGKTAPPVTTTIRPASSLRVAYGTFQQNPEYKTLDSNPNSYIRINNGGGFWLYPEYSFTLPVGRKMTAAMTTMKGRSYDARNLQFNAITSFTPTVYASPWTGSSLISYDNGWFVNPPNWAHNTVHTYFMNHDSIADNPGMFQIDDATIRGYWSAFALRWEISSPGGYTDEPDSFFDLYDITLRLTHEAA